jgi:organic radical activating enzyme
MRGSNPIRHQEVGDGQQLWIQEVFYTLQGEGPFMGQPAVFIRLAGCNLKCFWCDTDFESSTWKPTLAELMQSVESVRGEHCKLVVLTGGEPFRQNIRPLVGMLLENGLKVQIETNGTLWVELPRHAGLHIVCSPKTPGLHPSLVPRVNTYKYVLAEGEIDEQDGLPTASTQTAGATACIARPAPDSSVYVMPQDTGCSERNAANLRGCTESALRHGYNLTMQMHKLIGIR